MVVKLIMACTPLGSPYFDLDENLTFFVVNLDLVKSRVTVFCYYLSVHRSLTGGSREFGRHETVEEICRKRLMTEMMKDCEKVK